MIKYVFREDEPLRIKAANKANPQVLGEALAALTDKAGGQLKPKAVVVAARDKRSPLHPHFEWDDKVAAEAFRIEQARAIIRLIRVEDEDNEGADLPAFVSVNAEEGVSYRPVDVVKRSTDLQAALMKQAERDLEAFQTRYRVLKDICKDIEVVRGKLRARLPKNETREAA